MFLEGIANTFIPYVSSENMKLLDERLILQFLQKNPFFKSLFRVPIIDSHFAFCEVHLNLYETKVSETAKMHSKTTECLQYGTFANQLFEPCSFIANFYTYILNRINSYLMHSSSQDDTDKIFSLILYLLNGSH